MGADKNCLRVLSGLGAEGTVLHSTEFLDLKENKWIKTSSLKVGRTEHVMALVYGIPTVIGGEHKMGAGGVEGEVTHPVL